MKNVIVILASGVGNRFGDPVPKQYHLVHGRPVIEYTLSAALDSASADTVLVVARKDYMGTLEKKYGVEVVEGGSERNISFKRALDHIASHGGCERLVVVDAVNPLVTPVLLNRFFAFLDEYDAAITTSKVPTSLGCYDQSSVDRSRYYMIQNPQAYKFEMLYEHFDERSSYTVIAHQLPSTANIKLYWGFKDYAKIIYPHDIAVIEALMSHREKSRSFNCYQDDACLRFLGNMRKEWPSELRAWEKGLNALVRALFDRWSITEYKVNPDSWKGLVFEAFSEEYGDVVLKIVPPFTQLFDRNLVASLRFANVFMTDVYDYDKSSGAILLPRVIPGDYLQHNNNEQLVHNFFAKVYSSILDEDQIPEAAIIPSYADEIKKRRSIVERYDFERSHCLKLLCRAEEQYDELLASYSEVLIHGDLHRRNILLDGTNAQAIDPWAFFAVPPIELAVYVAYLLFDSTEDLASILKDTERLFDDIVPREDLEKALYVVLCVLLVGAIFGKDDDYVTANSWLEIIVSLFE